MQVAHSRRDPEHPEEMNERSPSRNPHEMALSKPPDLSRPFHGPRGVIDL